MKPSLRSQNWRNFSTKGEGADMSVPRPPPPKLDGQQRRNQPIRVPGKNPSHFYEDPPKVRRKRKDTVQLDGQQRGNDYHFEPNDQLILDVDALGVLDGTDDLFAVGALSSLGIPCLQVLAGDVRTVGLSPRLQNANVADALKKNGYTAQIHVLEETNAVNVPLTMAKMLKKCSVALVDEALQQATALDKSSKGEITRTSKKPKN
jgi:hypothetical protein